MWKRLWKSSQFCLLAQQNFYFCVSTLILSSTFEGHIYAVNLARPEACSKNDMATQFVSISRVESDKQTENSSQQKAFKIFWPVVNTGDYANTVLERPDVGSRFVVMRCMPLGQWVRVAEGQVQGTSGQLIWGAAVNDASSDAANAQNTGNLYPRPMVGDVIAPQHVEVRAAARITPKVTLSFADIFEKNDSGGYSLNLTENGKNLILATTERFRGMSGRLMIEAHLRKGGNRDLLEQESRMHAATVGQFITGRFRFEPNQVVAIGMGATELEGEWVQKPTWPAQNPAEKLVFRVVPR